MGKLILAMDRILSIVCILLSVALVASVVWQVFSRYVLGDPSTITDELSRFLFVWVGLLGAAVTLGKKRHLAMDYMVTTLTGRKQYFLKLLIIALCLVFAGVVMLYGGGALTYKSLSLGQVSPVMGIQMGWIYIATPVSGFCMLIYLLEDLFDVIKSEHNASFS